MDTSFLINLPLPNDAANTLEMVENKYGTPLFAIVGDLNLDGNYKKTCAFFTSSALIVYDGDGKKPIEYYYSSLKDVKSKRMYGNAVISAIVDNGNRHILFRFTYTISSICDAAALFINHINEGSSINDEYAVVGVAFENALSVCPKCGRHLLHPGAECIMCRSKIHVLNKFLKYIKPEVPALIACTLLSFITTFMALIPPSITGYIVDNVFPGGSGESGFAILESITSFASDTNGKLVILVLTLLASYLLNHGISIIRAYKMRNVGEHAVTYMRNDIYEKVQYLPMSFFDKTSTGAVINRINGDASTLQGFMLRISQEAVVQFFQMIGIVIIMVSINPVLTLYSLIPVPIIVIGSRYFGKKIKPFYLRIWRTWARVPSNLTDTVPNIKMIKSFTGEKKMKERFNGYNKAYLDISKKLGKLTTSFPQIISFFVTCGSLLIWLVGGSKVINGVNGYTAGLIVTFISYASMFYTPVSFFANLSDSYQNALSSAEKILDILDAESEVPEQKLPVPEKLKGEIEFVHVGFSFDRSKKVLDDVSFKIKPGEVVGIVGTTGSGKSTLINLLMRFYDGYSGEILVDGHNIRNFDLPGYRSQIGYVQQEPMMFGDTIFNNIAFGNPDASIEDVIHAADVANAHNFIAKAPEAYDTRLGERGIGVSGGEKQRISIARAVIKNPSIMIFDEATAAVDSETEKLIQDAIDKLIAGKTTIMIAHRLSTLKKANRILVVDKGHIIENGTPEELMAQKGKYYKLVQIQSMVQNAKDMSQEENLEMEV